MSLKQLSVAELERKYRAAQDESEIAALEEEMAQQFGFASADQWYEHSATQSVLTPGTYTTRSATEDTKDIKVQPFYRPLGPGVANTAAFEEISTPDGLKYQANNPNEQYRSVQDAMALMDNAIASFYRHGTQLATAEGLPHPGGVYSGLEDDDDPADRLYLTSSTVAETTGTLCEFCSRLDFQYLLTHLIPAQELSLGMLEDLMDKNYCPFCRLVSKAIRMSLGVEEVPRQHNGKNIEVGLKTVPKDDRGSLFDLDIVLWPLPRNAYSHIHLQRMADERDTSFQGRLIDPERANLDVIKNWIHDCERGSHHSAADHNGAGLVTEDSFLPSYVIDVKKNCIAQPEADHCRYLALSYVWGGPQPLQLLLKNKDRLALEGSLLTTAIPLPATIADAMELVRGLGERYLWCDALCIVQDDIKTKNMELSVMDKVYGFAVLTIIAGFGRDVHAGLPRVRRSSSRLQQQVEEVQGIKLVNRFPTSEGSIDKSVWNTRAWTYQERILAKRKLFVSEYQMTFKCPHTEVELCEDVYSTPVRPSQDHRADYWKVDYQSLDEATPIGSVNTSLYATIVQRFTARNLSVPSDILSAFAGVANQLAPLFRDGFRIGLPKTELDTQLLWQPQGSIIRRKDPDTGRYLFPSWSWAGWIGPVTGNFAGRESIPHIEFMHDFTKEWYSLDQSRGVDGNVRNDHWRIREYRGHIFWQEDEDARTFFAHPVQNFPGFRNSYRPYLLQNEHGVVEILPIRADVARFRITGDLNPHANLYLETRVNDSISISAMMLTGKANEWVGTVFVPCSLAETMEFGVYDCIKISSTSTAPELYGFEPSVLMPPETCYDDDLFAPTTCRRDQIDILVVFKDGGTAYRLGVGICHVRAFDEAEPEREVIHLG